MPRQNKASNAFADAAGRVPHPPQDAKGKFDTPRAKAGREHALSILNDKAYRRNLLKRMRAGEAGAVEVWVWRIGYGDPKKDEEDDNILRRIQAIRDQTLALLRQHPERAHVLDAMVQGAPRVLPRPIMLPLAPGVLAPGEPKDG